MVMNVYVLGPGIKC